MLHFTLGEPAVFHLTLSELSTLDNPNYLFVFERRVPGDTVKFITTPDASSLRSDEFVIDVTTIFEGHDPGQYAYRVYEQESDENLLPELSAGEVEHGVMQLHPEINFAYIMRESTISYKQR